MSLPKTQVRVEIPVSCAALGSFKAGRVLGSRLTQELQP